MVAEDELATRFVIYLDIEPHGYVTARRMLQTVLVVLFDLDVCASGSIKI